MNGREAVGKHLCFSVAEGEGQAGLRSAVEQASLSLCVSLPAGLGLFSLSAHCWQWGTSRKRIRLLLWPPWRKAADRCMLRAVGEMGIYHFLFPRP